MLVLLSLLFGWLAFANWRFKANLVEGYQEYDRGRAQAAINAARGGAVVAQGPHGRPRAARQDPLRRGQARRQRASTTRSWSSRATRLRQVRVGLGVLALKEVEALDKPKLIEAMVAEAAAEFKKVGGVPEAEIGLGHCELVLARKLANPGYYPRAQAIFAKVRNAMEQSREFRAQITRDGLVDYYTGLGQGAWPPGTRSTTARRDAFRACYQYTPTWSLPMANVL